MLSECEWVSEAAQSYLTLCDPMNCSLPGSSVHVNECKSYYNYYNYNFVCVPNIVPRPLYELFHLVLRNVPHNKHCYLYLKSA